MDSTSKEQKLLDEFKKTSEWNDSDSSKLIDFFTKNESLPVNYLKIKLETLQMQYSSSRNQEGLIFSSILVILGIALTIGISVYTIQDISDQFIIALYVLFMIILGIALLLRHSSQERRSYAYLIEIKAVSWILSNKTNN